MSNQQPPYGRAGRGSSRRTAASRASSRPAWSAASPVRRSRGYGQPGYGQQPAGAAAATGSRRGTVSSRRASRRYGRPPQPGQPAAGPAAVPGQPPQGSRRASSRTRGSSSTRASSSTRSSRATRGQQQYRRPAAVGSARRSAPRGKGGEQDPVHRRWRVSSSVAVIGVVLALVFGQR